MWTKYIATSLLLACAVLCSSNLLVKDDTSKGKSPFLVSLHLDNYYWCVGTIVASKWVLTAAHCTDVPKKSKLSVQYGVRKPSSSGPNVVPVRRVHVYGGWSPTTSQTHNIALIELEKRLPIDFKTIAPVTLQRKDYIGDVELPALLTSWTLNKTTRVLNDQVEEVPLMIQSNEECNRVLNGSLNPYGSVCTSEVGTGHEESCFICGGPLLYPGTDIQVGVAVFKNDQDRCAVPDLYTRVHRYTPWIRATIRKFRDRTCPAVVAR